MTWHDFSLTTVTPMFCGADPDFQNKPGPDDPSTSFAMPFPIASLRGALRYWLRALVGEHVGELRGKLAEIEAKTFGAATGRMDGAGASRLRLRARGPITVQRPGAAPDWIDPHVGYLLGPGLYNADTGRLNRRYADTGQQIRLQVENTDAPGYGELFLAALWALHTFGGLGARVRRGFGTVTVTPPAGLVDSAPAPWHATGTWARPDGDAFFDLCDQIRDRVGAVLDDLGFSRPPAQPPAQAPAVPAPPRPGPPRPGPPRPRQPATHRPESEPFPPGAPSYPCFRDDWCAIGDTPLAGCRDLRSALSEVGMRLRDLRLDGASSSPEYDTIVRPYLDGDPMPDEPCMLGAFGLPVVFSDRPQGHGRRRSATVEPMIKSKPARRASPLWLRPSGGGPTGDWHLTSLIFDAELLPARAGLRIKGGRRPERLRKPPSGAIKSHIIDRWFDDDSQADEGS
jgi:hypothetical protein